MTFGANHHDHVKSSEFVSWTRCSYTINYCYMVVNEYGRLSCNVDGHVDNYLFILCSMPLTIIVRLVFNIKKNPAMNNMTCL